jgi:hypothetical protein
VVNGCPTCGRVGPTVAQGLSVRCLFCGAPRSLFGAPSLGLVGRPTRALGTFVRVAGFLTLFGGVAATAIFVLFFRLLFPASAWGFGLGGVILALTTMSAFVELRVGGWLRATGDRAAAATRVAAIRALAEQRGGVLSARQVSHALLLDVASADAELTALALIDEARVELDDAHGVVYRFGPPELPPAREPPGG